MIPAIHSMLFAVRPSRSALMIGMPPATDASKRDHHALRVRGREDLGAVMREQRLVRGDHVLAVRDRVEHERARRLDAADQLADDVHVRMPDDDRRIVGEVHAGDAARAFARAVERARSRSS